MEGKGEIIIYQTEDGKSKLEVKLEEETLWLNLNQITKLFGRDKSVVSRHLKNIFNDNELNAKSTVAFFATVRKEGNREILIQNRVLQFRCYYIYRLSRKF